LDALPAKAGSASAAAIIKRQHRRHFSFHVEHFVSPLRHHHATPRPVLRPLCVAFNEEIVRGGDLFPS
jgi:hypothetical protein